MEQVNREENLGASISRSASEIASDYFDSIGYCLPYQCASDEFYFLPRSARALDGLGSLDALDPASVKGLIEHVRSLGKELKGVAPIDLEDEIDRSTLRKSIERFIWYFDSARSWRRDPTLYVKIALFAVDEVLSRDFESPDELRQLLASILLQIPGFLRQGIDNMERPSALSVTVASNMTRDAVSFFTGDVIRFIEDRLGKDAVILNSVRTAMDAWRSYAKSLKDVTTDPSFCEGETTLAEMFGIGIDYPRSPSEILAMAEIDYRSTLDKIRTLAKQMDSQKSWQRLVDYEGVAAEASRGVLEIYRKEVRSLRAFFYTHGALTFPPNEQVKVLPTPSYLRSLRATASYRAPLTGQYGRSGVFFITPGAELRGLILSHLSYLSAHETYPGHHVLDTIRLHHPNPIRRQIESPLFYEGWACYAETLLDELGYTTEAKQHLVQFQRQLWRDLRAVLDVRLQTGAITMAQAAREVEAIGFPPHSATRQVQRFALTPGYQSCYFLGMHEILRLREQFADHLGFKTFHNLLLEGGQLSFDLVKKRMDSATEKNQDKRC